MRGSSRHVDEEMRWTRASRIRRAAGSIRMTPPSGPRKCSTAPKSASPTESSAAAARRARPRPPPGTGQHPTLAPPRPGRNRRLPRPRPRLAIAHERGAEEGGGGLGNRIEWTVVVTPSSQSIEIRELPLPRILKSHGTTPSERQLSRLTNSSFLSLWAYPNVFRAPGKELCDVLVVCGDNVIVFSDKSISWPQGCSTKVAWGRWYRRAIGHSAKQVQRAVNWIQHHPDRVFLDSTCKEVFPIEIPRGPKLKVHGVVVARGAARACRSHFAEGSGSLAIMPELGSTNFSGQVPPIPFFVGNPSPDIIRVIHVLDDVSLPVALLELDTVTDLVRYLDKRQDLFLNKNLFSADGEEDLIALYLKDIGPDGDHDFVSSSGISLNKDIKIVVQGRSYDILRSRGEYKRKKAADKISYLWDRLIETFAGHILSDTSYVLKGYGDQHSVAMREIGLRYMALTSRLERRSHAEALKGAFKKIGERDRFFRAMLPPLNSGEKTGFSSCW